MQVLNNKVQVYLSITDLQSMMRLAESWMLHIFETSKSPQKSGDLTEQISLKDGCNRHMHSTVLI